MERVPIDSSMMLSVGCDAESGTLEIEFVDGRPYRYFDVPPVTVQALREADSAGAYFNAAIRGSPPLCAGLTVADGRVAAKPYPERTVGAPPSAATPDPVAQAAGSRWRG